MDEQIRIEYEIQAMKKNTLNILIASTKNKKEYFIDIIIPPSLIDPQIYDRDISFLLYLRSDKYPLFPPRLYCTTVFCFPHIADGRNILDNVLKDAKWTDKSELVSLLQLIPVFIKEYFLRGDFVFIGSYYLDERYDMKAFEGSGFDFKPVKENILINGKWTKFPRLLHISDLYFCLFDQDKKSRSKLSLVFWASINSIISIRKILVNKMIFIRWTQKDPNDPYEMNLFIDKGEEIVELLLNGIKQFGMNYNVTKEIKGQPPKEIEQTDDNVNTRGNEEEEMTIEKLKASIAQLEKDVSDEQQKPTTEMMQQLYGYYDNAEKFYETSNPEQAKAFSTKKEQLIASFNSSNIKEGN